MSETVDSRWWYPVGLTAVLGALALLASFLNILVGGQQWSASLMVLFWFPALGIGYLSLVPMYLDVRKIRAAVDYSPRYWLYALGAIGASPILASIVYIYNRQKHLS